MHTVSHFCFRRKPTLVAQRVNHFRQETHMYTLIDVSASPQRKCGTTEKQQGLLLPNTENSSSAQTCSRALAPILWCRRTLRKHDTSTPLAARHTATGWPLNCLQCLLLEPTWPQHCAGTVSFALIALSDKLVLEQCFNTPPKLYMGHNILPGSKAIKSKEACD